MTLSLPPHVLESLATVVETALLLEPGKRYPSAATMRAALPARG